MNVLKAAVSIGAVAVTMLGARAAMAGTVHGVVFIHGTGDYPGTMSCSGSGSGSACVVANAANNYWGSGEVNSVRNGRAYAVVGYNGGTCAPWPQGGEYGVGDPNAFKGSCSNPSGQGNADVIAAQIVQFINYAGINELEIVTHSGGSNQARYILQNYTKNTNYSTIKGITKRVVTIAATTLGTYLANEADNGGITSFIAGLVGYGGEGVRFIRTDYMSTYNGAGSFFGGINNPVQGVNVYSTGGISGSTCYGVTLWGACIGIKGPTLGGSSCASLVDDVGLLALHTLYLNSNDSSTARNSCSDGFISCMGSQRLGNTFAYAEKQDHNQSRNTCNNLDVNVRNNVSSVSGFADYGEVASQVSPAQVDACGFGYYAYLNTGSSTLYQEGCALSQLGNGNCDWECLALYGNDAVVATWADAAHTKPATWGASDCTATVASSPNTGTVTSTIPFAESGTYTSGSSTYNTAFSGYTCTGTSAQCGGYAPSSYEWFVDPNYTAQGTGGNYANSVASCPQSWVGDGICDECVLALYGSDGMDCAPGHVTACAGIHSANEPYYAAGAPMAPTPATAAGTPCTSNSQCPGTLSCNTSTGYCYACTSSANNASGSCNSSTYGWSGGTCNTTNGICYNATSEYYYYGNSIYSGRTAAGAMFEWLPTAAASHSDGVCENAECATAAAPSAVPMVSTSNATGTPCTNNNQCPGMLNCNGSTGYCYACTTNTNNAAGSCNSTTYGWSGGACNTTSGICYVASSLGAACNSNADCVTGTCVNGGCTTNGTDCSATYAVTPRGCGTNADCTGNACQTSAGSCGLGGPGLCPNGSACTSDASCSTCLLTGEACSSDSGCSIPSGATSTCSSGVCSCTTSNDCSGGAACTNGQCAATATTSLCR